jgi:hypothetical protein
MDRCERCDKDAFGGANVQKRPVHFVKRRVKGPLEALDRVTGSGPDRNASGHTGEDK